jgi:hypothetical protein
MVINQIHSIGDILFIEPICREYWDRTGKKPILPIRDHLMWLTEYIESAVFTPMSNQIIRGLDKNDHSDFENCMPDKYRLCGMDPDKWMDLKIKFNGERAWKLYEFLNLKQYDYVVVNNHSQAGSIGINPGKGDNIVLMAEIPGYTLLDWCEVIANAKAFHSVSTSTFYMLQAMANAGIRVPETFIYPRPNEDGLRGISKLNTTYKYTKIQ